MPEPELTSTAFADGAAIPSKYTGDGAGLSPPLAWSFLPEGTKSLALIVHDPDAPSGDFIHWVAWNIDPEPGGLGEGQAAPDEGANGRGDTGYMGPSPPAGHGAHRYFHELSAVDEILDLSPGASREELEAALDGHVLGKAQLMGTYERPEV
ncbi:MAG: YbhB/YbcL family Raf kinase inhibitor-like protein [Myxococcaceae bacterium]|jgi:Raf kinase inhibitor-like YbhB/YbcL family protein